MTEPEQTQALLPVQSLQLIEDTLGFCSSIVEIKIGTTEEYLSANELTKKVRAYVKNLDNDRKAIIKPHKEKVDVINATYKKPQQALKNLEERLANSLGEYKQEQKRIQEEKQRLADAEAQKERDRLQEESKKPGQEDLKRVAESIKTPVIPEKELPSVKGMHFRTDWKAEVIDKTAFIEYCLKTGELHFIEINMQTLNKIAQTSKGEMQLPGIKFYDKKGPVYR